MKRFSIYVYALLVSALCACQPDPIKREIPDPVPAIDGYWALLDASGRTDSYMMFYLGQCVSYSANQRFVVDNDRMWHCSAADFSIADDVVYSVKEDSLALDGRFVGKLGFSGNRVSSIAIDGHSYTHFSKFTQDPHSSEETKSIELDRHYCMLAPGEEIQLNVTFHPEDAYDKECVWSSDNPDVVFVTDRGDVLAISAGQANITVRTKNGRFEDFCHIVVAPNLSDGGTANCYIVSKSGWYFFNAGVKGNSSERIEGAESAVVLWETLGTGTTPDRGSIVTECLYDKTSGTLSFYARGIDGNAVVAVRDIENRILWSWHIWSCMDFDPNGTAQVYYNNAGTMMDRNLGATSAVLGKAVTLGLVYQWGRKDPFPGASGRTSENQAATAVCDGCSWSCVTDAAERAELATADPMKLFMPKNFNGWSKDNAMSWDTLQKSVYDPCPPGWRVMSGGSYGVWAVALMCPDTKLWTPAERDYYNDGLKLGKVLSDSDPVSYPLSGWMEISTDSKLTFLQMGYQGRYWTRTSRSSGVAYSVLLDRGGRHKDSGTPSARMDFECAYKYPSALRCEKE